MANQLPAQTENISVPFTDLHRNVPSQPKANGASRLASSKRLDAMASELETSVEVGIFKVFCIQGDRVAVCPK